ncbi:MAG: rod shape-determining protein RodA [Bacteroidales bacterium]|nr:rod shape-determining protein RodA [Bacteroidales bacterium]
MKGSYDRGLAYTVDWKLVVCYLLLVLIGIVNIYASVQGGEHSFLFDLSTRSGKQILWFGISLVFASVVLFAINPRIWEVLAPPAYFFVLCLLVAVIFLSKDTKGSRSWFEFGPVKFQPAELSKITTSLMLAAKMSRPTFRMSNAKDLFSVACLVGVPMLVIVAESETGSALVYVGFLFVLYREGFTGWLIFTIGMAILMFVLTLVTSPPVSILVLFGIVTILLLHYLRKYSRVHRLRRSMWRNAVLGFIAGTAFIFCTQFVFDNVLKDYQRARIEVLLGLREDPAGAGYNVHQSLIAIGSGGFTGKGFLQGTQTAYGFVPEQSTDFIFCTVGEEWGFIGCLSIVVLYALLIFWIIRDAEDSRSSFTRIYGYCLASCLFMHMLINIGMTIGLMPVIGIPLPFMSYGGSSLLAFTTMLFIFIALNRQENKYF